MKIAIVGTGYVGLVSGICLSGLGHEVDFVEKSAKKMTALERGDTTICAADLRNIYDEVDVFAASFEAYREVRR